MKTGGGGWWVLTRWSKRLGGWFLEEDACELGLGQRGDTVGVHAQDHSRHLWVVLPELKEVLLLFAVVVWVVIRRHVEVAGVPLPHKPSHRRRLVHPRRRDDAPVPTVLVVDSRFKALQCVLGAGNDLVLHSLHVNFEKVTPGEVEGVYCDDGDRLDASAPSSIARRRRSVTVQQWHAPKVAEDGSVGSFEGHLAWFGPDASVSDLGVPKRVDSHVGRSELKEHALWLERENSAFVANMLCNRHRERPDMCANVKHSVAWMNELFHVDPLEFAPLSVELHGNAEVDVERIEHHVAVAAFFDASEATAPHIVLGALLLNAQLVLERLVRASSE
mmetsp:Transcript_28252/g.66870  ORF Transcript_28252/g.66870 Transcript_28252/m.66870 type:complete len:332 (+) Transcript_28252:32-1027(+)